MSVLVVALNYFIVYTKYSLLFIINCSLLLIDIYFFVLIDCRDAMGPVVFFVNLQFVLIFFLCVCSYLQGQ